MFFDSECIRHPNSPYILDVCTPVDSTMGNCARGAAVVLGSRAGAITDQCLGLSLRKL